MITTTVCPTATKSSELQEFLAFVETKRSALLPAFEMYLRLLAEATPSVEKMSRNSPPELPPGTFTCRDEKHFLQLLTKISLKDSANYIFEHEKRHAEVFAAGGCTCTFHLFLALGHGGTCMVAPNVTVLSAGVLPMYPPEMPLKERIELTIRAAEAGIGESDTDHRAIDILKRMLQQVEGRAGVLSLALATQSGAKV